MTARLSEYGYRPGTHPAPEYGHRLSVPAAADRKPPGTRRETIEQPCGSRVRFPAVLPLFPAPPQPTTVDVDLVTKAEQLVIDGTGPVSFPLIPGVSPSGIEALHLLRRPTVRLSKALPGRSLPGGAFVFRGLSLYSRISRKRRKCVRVGRPLPGPPGVFPAIQGGVFRAFVPLSLGSLSRSHSR